MRGRKPKPEALHALAGNPGKRKRKGGEPAAEPARLDPYAPPSHLSAEQQRIWRREMEFFASAGYGKPSDLSAFAFYVKAVVRQEKAEAVVAEKGEYFTTPTGQVKEHPAAKAVAREDKAVKAWLEQLGLTPQARLRAAAALAGQRQREFDFGAAKTKPAGSEDPAPSAVAPLTDQDPDDPIGYGSTQH